jgi:hypothetical protein
MKDVKKPTGNEIPVRTVFNFENVIFNYIKNSKNEKIGLLISCKFKGCANVFFGWSLCHRSDSFDKELAFDIALLRAYSSFVSGDILDISSNTFLGFGMMADDKADEIPNSIYKDVEVFLKRTYKYYHQPTVIELFRNFFPTSNLLSGHDDILNSLGFVFNQMDDIVSELYTDDNIKSNESGGEGLIFNCLKS